MRTLLLGKVDNGFMIQKYEDNMLVGTELYEAADPPLRKLPTLIESMASWLDIPLVESDFIFDCQVVPVEFPEVK